MSAPPPGYYSEVKAGDLRHDLSAPPEGYYSESYTPDGKQSEADLEAQMRTARLEFWRAQGD